MRELVTMWRESRMIMLTAVTAAVYAAILLLFAGFVIIPGVTQIRPGNAIPAAFGLMFGPAGVWGAAIGNVIFDIFSGTIGPGSAWGFLGNFFFPLIVYKMWGNLGPLSSDAEPDFRENPIRQIVEYVIVVVSASIAGAVIISWGTDLLGTVPFDVLAPIISVNNGVASLILGPPILFLIYPRVKDMNLLYPDILHAEDMSDAPQSRRQLVAYGMVVVPLVWFAIGFFALSSGTTAQTVLGAIGILLVAALSIAGAERLSALID